MNNQRCDPNKTLICLTLILLVFFIAASEAIGESVPENVDEPVVVAYQPNDFPGSLTAGNGKALGVIIEFWLSWAAQVGIDIDLRIIDQINPLEAVRRGQADTTLVLFDELHSHDQFAFANTGLPVPFYIYHHYSIRGLRSVDDLRGFRIGVIQDTTAKEYLLRRLPNSTVLVYPTAEALLKAAEAGEIRVFVAPKPTMQYVLENRDLHYNYRFHEDTPLFVRELRPVVRRNEDALQGMINRGLEEIPAMQWKSLQNQWLSRTDDDNTLVITLPMDYPPLVTRNERGQPAGLLVDIWRLWAQQTGNRIRFDLSSWSNSLKLLREGRADIHGGLFRDPEKATWMAFSQPIYELESGLFVLANSGIQNIQQLTNKPVGVIKNSQQEAWLAEWFPRLKSVPFEDVDEMIDAALEGQLVGFMHEVPPTRLLLQQRGQISQFKEFPQLRRRRQLVGAVLEKQKNLLESINQGFQNISAKKLQAVEDDWISDPTSQYYRMQAGDVSLTNDEKAWLDKRGVIQIGLAPDSPPLLYQDEDGQLQGIVLDYLVLLQRKLNLDLQWVIEPRWSMALDKAKRRQIDLLPGTVETPQQRKWFISTQPYAEFQRVVVTRHDASDVTRVKDLMGRKVAVSQGSADHEWLSRELPQLDLITYANAQKALEAVSKGLVDAMVGNLMVVTWLLQEHHLADLKIATTVTGQVNQLRFAVRKDWPELVGILNKGLAAITPEEHTAVRQKWFKVQFDQGVDMAFVRRLVLQIVGLALAVVVIIILCWNRKLRREISERKRAQSEVKAQRDELERLATTDDLTGVWNRRRFMDLAAQEIKRAQRYGSPLAIVMIDIDHFKRINDTYGHIMGDLALIKTVDCIQHELRSSDVLGRIGGEEFVMLLPETGPLHAAQVAERLRQAISHLQIAASTSVEDGNSSESKPIELTISVGVTQLLAQDCSIDQALSRADQALYRAKRSGRNRVEINDTNPSQKIPPLWPQDPMLSLLF